MVSAFDRGFLYGDGLFEAVLVHNGKPFRWKQHWERFRRGADLLKIKPPLSETKLCEVARELIHRNKVSNSILRITLSRGVGERGYSPKGAKKPTLVMSLHAAPLKKRLEHWNLVTSSHRLPADSPFTGFKNNNKLPQILARAEADAAGANEALLRNTAGFVVEGTTSNLFWVDKGTICTPPVTDGILPGVTRSLIFEICKNLGLKTRESQVALAKLKQMEAAFLSLTSRGIVSAKSVDGAALKESALVQQIHSKYREILLAETE